jgi:hypothetical protein
LAGVRLERLAYTRSYSALSFDVGPHFQSVSSATRKERSIDLIAGLSDMEPDPEMEDGGVKMILEEDLEISVQPSEGTHPAGDTGDEGRGRSGLEMRKRNIDS